MQSNNGFYGEFGGQFVPETLIPALDELEKYPFHWDDLLDAGVHIGSQL